MIDVDHPSCRLTVLIPEHTACHFAYGLINCIFLIEQFRIFIQMSLKCVRRGTIDNKLSLVQIMVEVIIWTDGGTVY